MSLKGLLALGAAGSTGLVALGDVVVVVVRVAGCVLALGEGCSRVLWVCGCGVCCGWEGVGWRERGLVIF